jgi:MFS family permease
LAISPTKPTGPIDPNEPYPISRRYAWIAFVMIFALMLSDYLSRQVINAVFPFLKTDWSLSDTQLGMLVSVVALTIGLTAVPISIVADRVGRVRAVTAMALVWALATIACGLAESFAALLIARALVGLGEAGYGSTGAAILTRAFPARLHATVMSSYLAAGIVGSVLGIVLGGAIAQSFGWHIAFIAMGAFGLVVAALFPVLVKEPPPLESADAARVPIGRALGNLIATRTYVLVALANGLCMIVQTAYIAWLPSYLNRFFGLDPAKASYATGLLILSMSVGMVICGMVVDRVSRHDPVNRLRIITVYCLILGSALIGALSMSPGVPQFILIGFGMFLSASFLGPAMAVAADVTPEANHATAFGVMSLVTMLLGAAPGPFVAGKLADLLGLDTALLIVPVGALCGGACYFLASRTYARDREALRSESSNPTQ